MKIYAFKSSIVILLFHLSIIYYIMYNQINKLFNQQITVTYFP